MATAVAIWTMMAQPLPKSSARRPCVTPAASSSSGAALEKRPAASTCIPKPKASLIACLTACGRWVLSLDNASWRRGGQRAFLLHTPALPKSRSGHRCIGDRLLVDLGRSVDTEALQPVVHCTRCRQRFQSRSAQAHGLPRPGGLADGRVGRHGAFVSGHVVT